MAGSHPRRPAPPVCVSASPAPEGDARAMIGPRRGCPPPAGAVPVAARLRGAAPVRLFASETCSQSVARVAPVESSCGTIWLITRFQVVMRCSDTHTTSLGRIWKRVASARLAALEASR